MLNEHIISELLLIKSNLINSGIWPKSLSGACNTSSILVQSLLEKNNIDSTLVNNHKHAFNIIVVDGVDYVLDLTACQISNSIFPEDILFKPWEDVNKLANSTVKGKSFYYLVERKDFFFARGNLCDILKVNEEFEDDDTFLHRILHSVCLASKLDVNTDIKIDPENVNSLANEIITELAA